MMRVALKTMEAAICGWAYGLVSLIIIGFVITPIYCTMSLVSYDISIWLDAGFTSLVAWGFWLAVAASAGVGGWVAGGCVLSRWRWSAGLLAILQANWWFGVALLMRGDLETVLALEAIPLSICAAIVGAWVHTRDPVEAPRMVIGTRLWRTFLGWGLATGLHASVVLILCVALWPLAETRYKESRAVFGRVGDAGVATWVAGAVALALVGLCLFVLVRTRGWRHGVLRNRVFWFATLLLPILVFGFLRRDATNQPEVAYPYGEADEKAGLPEMVAPDSRANARPWRAILESLT